MYIELNKLLICSNSMFFYYLNMLNIQCSLKKNKKQFSVLFEEFEGLSKNSKGKKQRTCLKWGEGGSVILERGRGEIQI